MIQTQYTPEHSVGDGTTAALPFTWRILAKTDVVVLAKDPDTGEVTMLELDSDYTIDDADVNNDDGGDVVLDDAAAWDGFDIWLIRNTALTQLVNIEPGGTFSAAQVMTALDRLTMIVQDLKAIFGTAVAGDAVRWDSTGKMLEAVPDTGLIEAFNAQVVAGDAEYMDFTFATAQLDNGYAVAVFASNWQTTWSVPDDQKTVSGFRIEFGNSAPSDGSGRIWVRAYAAT